MAGLQRQPQLWVPVVAWLMVIALFSTDFGSRSATESTFLDLLRSWWPTVASWLEEGGRLDSLSFVLRKAAHVGEYAVLAFLLGRALRDGTGMRGMKALAVVLVVCVVVASADEWHQSLVTSRTGSLVDVGIDSVGAAVASIWFQVRGRQGLVKDSRVERG